MRSLNTDLDASQDRTLIKPLLKKKDDAIETGDFLGEFAVLFFTDLSAMYSTFNDVYKQFKASAKEQMYSGLNVNGTEKLFKHVIVDDPTVNRGDYKRTYEYNTFCHNFVYQLQ